MTRNPDIALIPLAFRLAADHCDNPVIFADYAVAMANGAYVLVHKHCLSDALEEADDD